MNLRTPRIIGTVLAATAALCIQVSAAKPLLSYEGTELSGAVRQGNTICVPFRAAFEYLGYEVDWVNGQAIADGRHYIIAQPGECKVTIDGKTVDTPVPVYLQNQRTIVPVRALFEAMGMTVTYDPASGTATVTSPVSSTQKPSQNPVTPENPSTPVTPEKPSTPVTPEKPSTPVTPEKPSTPVTPEKPSTPVTPETPSIPVTPETPPAENEPAYSESDLFWLARIVEAEAGGESSEGKLAVANVVLNRVDCSEYPDNIYDVIFDTKYGTQFEPTSNGTVYNTPSEESIAAAKAALEGENNIGDALYFYNPSLVDAVWIRTNCEYLETIGCHDFFQ